MSIKDEFEKGLAELMGKIKAGDTQAMKSLLGIVSQFQHPETIEDSIVMSLKEENEYELLANSTDLLSELKKLTLWEQLERLPDLLADIDQKSYLGMSKRRKKRFLSRLRMYEVNTGKLASVKHLGKVGFKSIPMIHVFVESVRKPLEEFVKQWVGILRDGKPFESQKV